MWVICPERDECTSTICGHLVPHEFDHWCEGGKCRTIGKEVECLSVPAEKEVCETTG